jgi:uncharacterized protein (TIGR03083 family)
VTASGAGAQIRVARPEDDAAIVALLRTCFPGEPVDALVAALRAGPTWLPELALVAEDRQIAGGAMGFVMLTTVELEGTPWRPGVEQFQHVDLLCLSPLAVHPAAQGRGLARALVERAVALAGQRGREPFLVLEGDPALYRRFGFVDAREVRLWAPSERIPPGAFQAITLPWNGSRPEGRVRYSPPFWEVVTPGLPVEGITWLDELERQCRAVELALGEAIDAATGEQTVSGLPVAACPGWTVTDVLTHLAKIQRLVGAWLATGRRPRKVPALTDTEASLDPFTRFGRGWRALQDELAATPPDAPAATWCAWDATNRFWRRRMTHEHAVHALDLLDTLGRGDRWQVAPDVAADGVDEALRLWLGTQLGNDVGGSGDAVRLVALGANGEPVRGWVVVLHATVLEIVDDAVWRAGDVEAEVRGPASDLYRWVWGRGAAVRRSGSTGAVELLQAAFARATI